MSLICDDFYTFYCIFLTDVSLTVITTEPEHLSPIKGVFHFLPWAKISILALFMTFCSKKEGTVAPSSSFCSS